MQGNNFCSFTGVTTKLGVREVHDQAQKRGVHELPCQDRSCSCSINEETSKTMETSKYDRQKEDQIAAKN